MIMLISAPLVSANSAIAENTFVFMASGPSWTTSSSGPSDSESRSEDAARLARLLGHVDGVLEADQREERERGAREDRQRHRLARLEVERRARVAAPVEQERQ